MIVLLLVLISSRNYSRETFSASQHNLVHMRTHVGAKTMHEEIPRGHLRYGPGRTDATAFTSGSSSLSSISSPRGSLGHHRWFHNQFPPFFPVPHCPLRLDELQACPFPDVVFPHLPLSALSSSPFHCALHDGFGQVWHPGHSPENWVRSVWLFSREINHYKRLVSVFKNKTKFFSVCVL